MIGTSLVLEAGVSQYKDIVTITGHNAGVGT